VHGNARRTSAGSSNAASSGSTPSSTGGAGVTATTGTINNLVPLRAVTRTSEIVGPQAVNHLNQFTSVTINFNLLPGVAIGDAKNFIDKAATEVRGQFPSVQGTFQGEAQVFEQLFSALPLLLLSAIFVMYVILGILYESYVHPITVLFPAIVPAVVGGLFTLWIFHSTLSLYSVIGLFLLLGIVKKNGIMVVDFALQRIDEGWSLRDAIHEASIERFRPIMMTTLAALMGAIPLALGYGSDGKSRQPLGLVIVGGLIFSNGHLVRHRDLSGWNGSANVLDRVPFCAALIRITKGDAPPHTNARWSVGTARVGAVAMRWRKSSPEEVNGSCGPPAAWRKKVCSLRAV
jgi:HAE1 family hydrophobic/amphiphilic exporter-1